MRFWPRPVVLLPWLALVALGCEEDTIDPVVSKLVVNPTSIDMGDVVIGLSGEAGLELSNDGAAILTVSGAPDSALGGEFILSGMEPALAPGERLQVALHFEPTSVGARSGELIFTTSSREHPEVRVPVTARGVEPALIAEPAVIDFGRVLIGRTSTVPVTLRNRSDRPVEVVRTALDSGTSAEFGATVSRTMLDPGATMTMVASYAPLDLGLDEGRLIVIDSSVRPESLGVRVRGTGVDTDVVIEPLRLEYSGLYVGQTQTKQFVMHNIGDRPHDVSELVFVSTGTAGAAELSMRSTALPIRLAPDAVETVEVTYRPRDAVADHDQVRVVSTGLPQPALVEILAQADPAPAPILEVTPASLDFGNVETGMTRPLVLRLANVGTADLRLDSVEVVPGSAPYTLTNAPTPTEIFRPRDSRDVTVTFSPVAEGAAPAASVVITSTDPLRPTVTVPLTGQGVNSRVPIIFVSPNPLDFGGVPRGVPASRPVLVRNDGSAPLVINQVRLTNSAGGRFLLPSPPAAGTRLDPTQSLNFSVDYSDNGVVATYNGTLEIASNDPARPTLVVALKAATEPPPPALIDIKAVLTWTRPETDVDLHLVAPGRTFFNQPGDCCFCNAHPDWGIAGQTLDDPFLDRDDLQGPGPEEINLSQAETGDYTVMLHYFNDHGHGDSEARVVVSIRGTVVADVTKTLGPNQRWTVGTVHFDAATHTGTWTNGFFPPLFTLFRICQ